MNIRIAGIGDITLEELEARFAAYLNAGAPEPRLEGEPRDKREILELVASRGDAQMKALMASYLDPGADE